MGSTWYLEMLGGLSLRQADDLSASPLTHFRTQKQAALLAFLALHLGHPQPRDELIERFWPGARIDAGRMNLRTALAALRKILEPQTLDAGKVLSTSKSHASLLREALTTDVEAFAQAIARTKRADLPAERIAALRQAVALHRGPLLPGVYEDWTVPERERLAAENQGALAALTHHFAAAGNLSEAILHARRAAAADPLSDTARGDLIRLLRRAGRSSEALRQFQDLRRLWREYLDHDPPETVSALVADLPETLTAAAGATEETPEPRIHLPGALPRLWGRKDEVAALVSRLSGGKADGAGERLLTLVGAGGVGKTRLAIEAARRLALYRLFECVAFVSLAAAADEHQAFAAIAEALGVAPTSAGAPRDRAILHLRERTPALLVLDNLEQLEAGGGFVAQTLLDAVPELILLTTSRRRLAVPGERIIPVSPLPTAAGIALFVERSRAVAPEFVETPDVPALVDQMEGFPLAIELAAAWSAVQTPAQILSRLRAGRLSLPADPRREARHMSLEATIAWSVDLLDPDLRRIFLALSAFRGGFDSGAAQAVCDATSHALAALRDRSLLRIETADAALRFSLHETLREFGERHLAPAAQADLQRRHARHFAARASGWTAQIETHARRATLAALAPERANLYAAVERALVLREDDALRALVPLFLRLWEIYPTPEMLGLWRQWRRVLHPRRVGDPHWRAELALQDAEEAARRLAFRSARNACRRARAAFDALGDRRGVARALDQEARLDWMQGEFLAAERRLAEAAALWETLEAPLARMQCRYSQAILQCERGQGEKARPTLEETLAWYREIGDPLRVATNLLALGEIDPEPQRAQARIEEALAIYGRETLPAGYRAHALQCLARCFARQDRLPEAEDLYRQALALFQGQETGTIRVAQTLAALADLAERRGDGPEARRLWRQSLPHWQRIGDRNQQARATGALERLAGDRDQGSFPPPGDGSPTAPA